MASVEATGFEILDYLEERALNPSFVMAELGYGRLPIVGQQPHSFTGQQAYIGIEAGMRGRASAEKRALRLREEHSGINAFFLMHSLGEGRIKGKRFGNTRYRGDFDTETILPERAADEVVVSNVFCDPLIARDQGRTIALLQEAARLVTPAGKVVLRDNVSPEAVEHIHHHSLRRAGLEAVRRIRPSDTGDWKDLEQVYGTHYDVHDFHPPPESYYLFLAKIPGVVHDPAA